MVSSGTQVARAKSPDGTVVAVKKTWTPTGSPPRRCAPDSAAEADALRAAAHTNVVLLLDVIPNVRALTFTDATSAPAVGADMKAEYSRISCSRLLSNPRTGELVANGHV